MKMKIRTFVALLWIFALVYWNTAIWQELLAHTDGDLTVSFLDIGQGDAIFVEAPNGTQMLIDGGENERVIESLQAIMPRLDRNIDIVLATHPDADHIGGLDDVLKHYEVSLIVDNGKEEKTTKAFESFEKEINNEISSSRAVRVAAVHGMRIMLDNERSIYFDIFYPTASSTHPDSNELSVVGRLVYGNTSFLLTGDIGKEVEQRLIQWCGQCLKSDVLKVGHHGSKNSSGHLFIDAVQPRYAVISAGKNNTYRHPHKDVIDRLINARIEILETSKNGTIMFRSNGREVYIR